MTKDNKNKGIIIAVAVAIVAVLALVVSYMTFVNGKVKVVWADESVTTEKEKNINYVTMCNIIGNQKKVTLIENGTKTTKSLNELGVELSIDEIKEDDNSLIRTVYLNHTKFNCNFDKMIENMNNMNNSREVGKAAILEKGETGFILTEAVKSTQIDIDKVTKFIENNINDSNELEINLNDYYKVIEENEEAQKNYENEITKVKSTVIEYTNGYKISLMDLYDYLVIKDDTIVLDEEHEEEYKEHIDKTIEKELKEYDTYGKERVFNSTNSGEIKISGGTYGNIFDSDKETEYIIDKFSKYESESERVPIYRKELPADLGNTYIEVSIDEQHIWYYKDGNLVMDSSVVTGTKERNDTPRGVYYISECINGKYLRGDGYKTWVNKWMRLTNTGIGLHDATWRSSFGGSIYKSNGSHGCINLPKKFAYDLFEEAYVNMPVTVY